MKITPDASLFQALSNFPRVHREAINPAPGQAQGNNPRVAPDPRQTQTAQVNRQKQAAQARQSNASTSGELSRDSNRSANPYAREAPGVDQKPAFKRLGQIIDISV